MIKLNSGKVLEIRSKRAAGQTQESLSREYRVSINTIRSVCRGNSWQDLELELAPPDGADAAASQARLEELLGGSAKPEPIEEDPLEAILRRRSRQAIPAGVPPGDGPDSQPKSEQQENPDAEPTAG